MTKLPCQICLNDGHDILECTHRMNFSYQGREIPSNIHAMLASASLNGENPWYADSCATQHITSDMSYFSDYQSYNGSEQIQTANGEGMKISAIGNAVKNLMHNQILLPKILHVPSASQKLLSVHRFTSDNNCSITFESDKFFLKDLYSGRKIFPRAE